MTLTNILLALIAVLLLARIVLQLWQGKRAFERGSEVEYKFDISINDPFAIAEKVNRLGMDRWELASIMSVKVSGEKCQALFFTRKKIKNYYDGKQ